MSDPEKAAVVVQPKTPPSKAISSFTPALQCMDDLLWQHGKSEIYITSSGIPDATGKVSTGTRDMLISAVSRMSAKSNGFRFVDFEPDPQSDVTALYSLIGVQPSFTVPSYYIRGAITQLDENVLNDLQGAALSMPSLEIGASRDQVVSVITVDLNLGELVTRQILPGLSANNSLAVIRSGVSGDAGGRIDKAGLSFNISINRSEGMHAAVRTLLELSAIELLGKLTKVPYWRCLGIDETNPTFRDQARDWYDDLKPAERVSFVQQHLLARNYYAGTVDGQYSDPLQEAAARFQADNGLIATGRIDFDLYYALLGATGQGRPPRPQPVKNAGGTGLGEGARRGTDDLDLYLDTNRGPVPVFKVGEPVLVRAQPTSDAFLYCFYTDGQGEVARVFPNRFQANAFVPANQRVEIPPGFQKPFNIRPQNAGAEEAVVCFASGRELGLALPDDLKVEDLTPIGGYRMQEVVAAFTALGAEDLEMRRVNFQVVPANTVDF